MEEKTPPQPPLCGEEQGDEKKCLESKIPPNWPSHLDTRSYPYLLKVISDRVTVTYLGKGNHLGDAGSVRAAQPVPADADVYYFEMTVLEGGAGTKGDISIGLAPSTFSLDVEVGTTEDSFGFRSGDGKFVHNDKPTLYSGVGYGKGDVIGCGINFYTKTIFFTKNASSLGPARLLEQHNGNGSSYINLVLFPTISLHSMGVMVKVNFGETPFCFDIEAVKSAAKKKREEAIHSTPLNSDVLLPLIRSYFLSQGFERSLKALDKHLKAQPEAGEPNGKEVHSPLRIVLPPSLSSSSSKSAVRSPSTSSPSTSSSSSSSSSTLPASSTTSSSSSSSALSPSTSPQSPTPASPSRASRSSRLLSPVPPPDAAPPIPSAIRVPPPPPSSPPRSPPGPSSPADSGSCRSPVPKRFKKTSSATTATTTTATTTTDAPTDNGVSSTKSASSLRAQVRALIFAGKFDEVVELLKLHAPSVLEKRNVMVRLRCLQFLGLVKNQALLEAVQFAQANLVPFHGSEWQSLLTTTMGVLAYPSLSASPYSDGSLFVKVGLTPEDVALWLNRALLEHDGLPTCSSLETLMAQLKVLHHISTQHLPAYRSLGALDL